MGKEEEHLDLADDDQAHVRETIRRAVQSQVLIVHLDLVLAEVLDEEAVIGDVPRDLRVFLADGILVGQTKVVRVSVAPLSPDVHFQ